MCFFPLETRPVHDIDQLYITDHADSCNWWYAPVGTTYNLIRLNKGKCPQCVTQAMQCNNMKSFTVP